MTDGYDEYTHCLLCPRQCGTDRYRSEGACRSPAELRLARAALHFWEEPCLSGQEGSGTVFFSGCSLLCVYCQNREISRGKSGVSVSRERLAEIFLSLQKEGANNINLVTPTHYTPTIALAIRTARTAGLHIPVVYNTSGYETVENIEKMNGLVDIYLADFKYMNTRLSQKYSGAKDYPAVAKAAADAMVRQVGPPVFDDRGIMQKGVIFRLLLLPGALLDAKAVLHYLYRRYGESVYYSLMNQYTPPGVVPYPELTKRVSPGEYRSLVRYAMDLGIRNAFIQDKEAAKESFIPPFDHTGL